MGRAAFLAALVTASAALAEEKPVVLADGPGRDTVEQNCSSCHSLDYIQMNSRFLDAKGWEGSVTKMVNAFGAPIDPKDAKTITDYLAKHYGK
jgi:hypothetical protein